MKKMIATVFLFSLTLSLLACETPDDNSIEKARACVDSAARLEAASAGSGQALAAQCETSIASLSTPEAGKVGFGAVLIESGLMTKITQLASAMQNQSQAVTSGVGAVVLASNATNDGIVSRMTNYATLAGSSGVKKLSDFIYFAYKINQASSVGSPTPASVAAAIGAANNPTSGPATAAAIVDAQQQACAGSGSSTDLCKKLTAAIGTADTTNYSAVLTNVQNFVSSGG